MTEPALPAVAIDLDEAQRFLDLLDAGGQFTFQTFDDSKAKRGAFARIVHGTLAENAATLVRLNDDGAGAFVVVSETDGLGRERKNVTRVRALFVDLDGAPIEPVTSGPLAPHLVVESSPGRWHAYWLVSDVSLEQFRPLQRGLIARFGADKAVHDLPRVMRLPGFVHRKAEPVVTRITSVVAMPAYALSDVLAAFGWVSAEQADPAYRVAQPLPRQPLPASGNDDVADDLHEALQCIPSDDYDTWIKVMFALKTLGGMGENLFHEWSSRSSKYDAENCAKVWSRITPDSTSHQAVFAIAKTYGWDPANAPSIKRKREARARQPVREDGPLAPLPPDDMPPMDEGGGERDDDADEAPAPLPLPAAAPTTVADCLTRFELIYGGNKVWDCATQAAITYFNFAALVGRDLAKAWQADSTKRVRMTPQAERKKKEKREKGDPTKLAMLLERYVLIYGTEAVFDLHERIELTLAALRAFAGLQSVRAWTDHPHRRVIKLDHVVFDPRRPMDDPKFCNLWQGWPTAAEPGDASDQELCRRWRAVLYYAVGNNDEVFGWLLKWMAYQVRYPGTKMKTSVIFHGPEGSGKNTVWDGFRRLFGPYGRSITQTQLESQWTDWISCKLFIVGNEVLHRQEQIQQKGRLKTLITEDEVSIERKHLPGREEPNYCNLVFLSNEAIPLSIDPGDRRFLVVWTPPPHPDGKQFYEGLSQKEMPDSTVRAIYHFLLSVDLGDFGPHTKPPMTKAKQELIDASLPSAPRFVRDWRTGELEVPHACCRTQQLYAAYQYWCRLNGEKFPWPENRFAAAAKKEIKSDKKRYLISHGEKQAMFYLPTLDTRTLERSEAAWLGDQVDFFEKALNTWRNGQ